MPQPPYVSICYPNTAYSLCYNPSLQLTLPLTTVVYF
nr:MAG TPA: hypothetical protein [Caudoviricetes sp.]DAT46088.1 MAG TPA: hypothetical protein [Caudoviricetes sp.]